MRIWTLGNVMVSALFSMLLPQHLLAAPIEILAVHYPPYEFSEPEDGLHGFDHEVVLAAFESQGIEAKISYTQWSRAVGEAERGKAAGILSCASSPEREEKFFISESISSLDEGYMGLESFSGTIEKIEDGKNYRVGAILSYVSSEHLTNAGVPHDLSRNDTVALLKLRDGRIDLVYSDIRGTLYKARAVEGLGDLKTYTILSFTYHLCISKKWPDGAALMEDFNRGLAAIRADGTYEAIHARYR